MLEAEEDRRLSLSALIAILDPNAAIEQTLAALVKEAKRVTACDHVFLSHYDEQNKIFRTLAFDSTITPTSVSLEQKFRGDQYAAQQTVLINDLSYYNFRLRPEVARLGLNSLLGLPLVNADGLYGVLECFSHDLQHFSDQDAENITVLAKQAVLLIEKSLHTKACDRQRIENQFLYELQELEHASEGMLLYRFGETLQTLFQADGIAVFGVEQNAEQDSLQEVLATGFSMNDVKLLKDALSRDFLARISNTPSTGGAPLFIRQALNGDGTEHRLINIVPIALRTSLHGILIYYWRHITPQTNTQQLETVAGRLIHHVASVLEKKSLYSNIQRLTFTDALTQLANRRLFDYVLGREFDKVKRNNTPLSLLIIDIDYFKQVNDSYGHLVGDAVLEQLGQRLRSSFRSIDLPARYGGEEFAVILPNLPLEKAIAVAERFRQETMEVQFSIGQQVLRVTISIGAATYSMRNGQQYPNKVAFLRAADQALYQAKQQGRNRTVAIKNGDQI